MKTSNITNYHGINIDSITRLKLEKYVSNNQIAFNTMDAIDRTKKVKEILAIIFKKWMQENYKLKEKSLNLYIIKFKELQDDLISNGSDYVNQCLQDSCMNAKITNYIKSLLLTN